jgi:hypothetical protein
MISQGAPNACNLCHLDRSLGWTLAELERGWGRRLKPGGADDLERPVGEAWLSSSDPHLRLLASQSYARSPLGRTRLADLVGALNDPEPINRVFHLRAVEAIAGRKLSRQEYELTAPPAERQRQIQKLLADSPARH